MPRPARSPTPTRPQGVVEPAFRGAREGRVRWVAELGPGRHVLDGERLRHWYHIAPEQPLVRTDGVVVTDWHGVARAHGPGGEPLWQRDLVEAPERPWAELWGRLLHVDEEDATWASTRAGLLRLSRGGEPSSHGLPEVVGPGSPGLGRPLAWGGFVRSYGTDEHYWTGHWPCCEGVVELLDGDGRLVARHAVGLAPGWVHVVGRRIAAFFHDDHGRPAEREEALVLDETGVLLERRARPGGAAPDLWRGELLAELATAQGVPRAFAAPGEQLPHEGAAVVAPGGERAFAASPLWEETVRLLALRPGREPEVALRDVSADPPTVDADGVCYATQAREGRLRLVGLGAGGPVLDCPLLDGPELGKHAFAHGGRPARVWAATRWFHAPTALGPDGSTLVLTDLGRGCALFCVE